MKLSNVLVIAFISFCLVFYTIMNIDTMKINLISYKEMELNSIIDRAVLDGLNGLGEGEGYGRELSKDKVLERFYNTLYLNLGIEGDVMKQEAYKSYIKAVFLVDYDGINSYSELPSVTNEYVFEKQWNTKVPFTRMYGDFLINYTVTDNVQVYNVKTGATYIADYRELAFLDIEHFQNDDIFQREKSLVITATITQEINETISEYNQNVSYDLMLPLIDEASFNNKINDISMFVFVDNIPIVFGEKYSYYCFGGGRLYNSKEYYLTTDTDGTVWYHSVDCVDIDKSRDVLITNLEVELKNRAKAHSCNY